MKNYSFLSAYLNFYTKAMNQARLSEYSDWDFGPVSAYSVHRIYDLLLLSTGTDEQAIIEVLTKRSNMQRQEIAKSFKAQFGKVLPKQSHIQSLVYCMQDVANGRTVHSESMMQTICRSSAISRLISTYKACDECVKLIFDQKKMVFS